MKTNPWTYKIKHLNGEKTIGSSYEKKLLLRIFEVNYYLEPDSNIRDIYATKKELEHSTGIDTSDLAAEKDFTALKAKVDKLDTN